jgi:hypothetical protein
MSVLGQKQKSAGALPISAKANSRHDLFGHFIVALRWGCQSSRDSR